MILISENQYANMLDELEVWNKVIICCEQTCIMKLTIIFFTVLRHISGLAKILKKYDKRTGGLLRLPFIQKVLRQPFFTTDLVSDLIKECEVAIDAVFPVEEREKACELKEVVSVADEGIFRKSIAALMTMQEIRKGSSTYSHFSLPPLNLHDSDLAQFLQLNSPIRIP